MRMQRDFLLSVTLAAATATVALGQTATPSSGPADSATQRSAPIPDFSGIWAHLTWPDVEPPLSGPGPVRNTSRRNGVSDVYKLVGDHTNPILKPQAAQVVKKAGDVALGGATFPTPSNQCWPGGVPYVFWDYLLQMFQQSDRITMIYRHGNEVRRVRMNQPHPVQVTPSWYGDSVGHYEGDTLVIDTVGLKIGPFAMVDMYGTPFTEKLHVVERYRLVDYEEAKGAIERNRKENFEPPGYGGAPYDPNDRGKVLLLHFAVEDEGVFTTPWTSTITYRRSTGPWTELICAENRREYYAEKDSEVPHADKPDF
jgi:hypothetical protein